MIEVVQKGSDGLKFIVKSKSGKILLKSIAFNDKAEMEKIVRSLASSNNPLYKIERKTDFDGKFLFNLKNREGKIIGSSGLYSSEAGMENGIKNLRNNLSSLSR
ncbi:YegP family protein [Maribacter sp. 2304DJ31-5]|uniref:YegP family protein n=1 Tax=Maribacter sp. 2304DJ31-5 TaxID=3386273 RepID=UPI0039BD6103